jgi:hypothetical protein
MPNWCDNSVRFMNADKAKIDALLAALESEDKKVFHHLRPMPDSEQDDWYMWNVNHWGTKWEISVNDWDREDDNTIWIGFETAWSPPIALYEYLYEEGWEIEAVYHEGGMAFCGIWKDGEDDCYEYDISDRDSIESLPEEILDFTGLLEYHKDWVAENLEDEHELGEAPEPPKQ